ncbi:MAG: hypothetical protein ACR2M3_05165 [Thermomicrobiales bacterium]
MEMLQVTAMFFFVVVALLAMLFVALVAGAATADRARLPVITRRSDEYPRRLRPPIGS